VEIYINFASYINTLAKKRPFSTRLYINSFYLYKIFLNYIFMQNQQFIT